MTIHKNSKLTAEQEVALVAEYASGVDTAVLSERFRINVTTVRKYGRRAGIFRGTQPRLPPERRNTDEREHARIERLTAYDQRSVTGRCFGDPPVGFSALERK